MAGFIPTAQQMAAMIMTTRSKWVLMGTSGYTKAHGQMPGWSGGRESDLKVFSLGENRRGMEEGLGLAGFRTSAGHEIQLWCLQCSRWGESPGCRKLTERGTWSKKRHYLERNYPVTE